MLSILPASAGAQAIDEPLTPPPAMESQIRFAERARSRAEALLRTPAEAVPVPAMPQPGGMTLDELEQIALARNPTLAQASAQVQAARGTWLQAGLYPNPSFGYVGSEIGNDGQGGQQGVFVGQEFVTGGKLRLDRNAASQQVRQAEAWYAAQQQRVINDVRNSYYQVLVAQRSLELSNELLRIGNEGYRTAEQLFEAQDISRIDLLQARIEADQATVLLRRAENRRTAAWRALTAVLGMPDLPPQPLAGHLDATAPPLDWNETLYRILAESPELGAAQADAARAGWALRRAQIEPKPNVDVQASTQYDDATQNQVASAQIGISVPIFNKNQGNIRRAEAELTAARAEISRIELDLQNRLAAAFERNANARQQTEIYSQQILPNARRSLELVTAGYRAGQLDYLNLLTAQRTYFQTSVTYLEALGELQQSLVAIDGLLLSGGLQRADR
jgi:cobalt-zinc-cadmium efflux system outer membrane protein